MENKSQKLLESLTPGGSEFENDPEYCVKYIKDFQTSQHKQIVELVLEKRELSEGKRELLEVLNEIIAISDRSHIAWDKAKELIKKEPE